jgi:tyrosine-protein kinase Etk/Wzc
MESHKKVIQDESINIRSVLNKLMGYWYVFAISLIIFCLGAYFIIYYSQPKYKVGTTVLVRDDANSSMGAENIIEGLELFSGKKNIENEIGILRSYSTLRQVINELNFVVTYYKEGHIKKVERYKDAPFKVIVDTEFPQAVDLTIMVTILNEKFYILTAHGKNVDVFDYKNDKLLKDKISNIELNDTIEFGKPCVLEGMRFTLLKAHDNNENLNYSFKINNLRNLTENYRKNLSIEPINGDASILKITLDVPVPEKDIDFLDKLCEVYIRNGLIEKNLIASNTIDFINHELTIITDTLFYSESQLENFKSSNSLMNIEAQALTSYDMVRQLENELAAEEVKSSYYDYLEKYVNENKELNEVMAPSVLGIQDQLLNSLLEEIKNLNSAKSSLINVTKEKNPSYISIVSKLASAKNLLNENLINLKSNQKIVIDNYHKRIDKLGVDLKTLPEKERKLINIQRLYSLSSSTYNYLLQKRSEATIAKAATTSDNKIIDKARVLIDDPVSPNKKLIYFAAIVLGSFFPLVIVILKEVLNDTVSGKEQIERYNIPVLGIVGHNYYNIPIPVVEHPRSSITESIRTLRINMQFLASDVTNKVIGITSTYSGEGKTFCAVNLAAIISATGVKVIILGCDLRKPTLHKLINVSSEVGLTSYLIGQSSIEQVIRTTEIPNLDVIVAGPLPPNPSELLGMDRMAELFTELKKTYQYIIIDSSPVGLVADYFVITKHIDITIFLVRNGYTKLRSLEELNDMREKSKINNLYVILNDVKSMAEGYGYKYSGYYEDEDQSSENIFKRIMAYFKKKSK